MSWHGMIAASYPFPHPPDPLPPPLDLMTWGQRVQGGGREWGRRRGWEEKEDPGESAGILYPGGTSVT